MKKKVYITENRTIFSICMKVSYFKRIGLGKLNTVIITHFGKHRDRGVSKLAHQRRRLEERVQFGAPSRE